jgi:hypothetical protein
MIAEHDRDDGQDNGIVDAKRISNATDGTGGFVAAGAPCPLVIEEDVASDLSDLPARSDRPVGAPHSACVRVWPHRSPPASTRRSDALETWCPAAACGEAVHSAAAALLGGDRRDRALLRGAVASDREQAGVEVADDRDVEVLVRLPAPHPRRTQTAHAATARRRTARQHGAARPATRNHQAARRRRTPPRRASRTRLPAPDRRLASHRSDERCGRHIGAHITKPSSDAARQRPPRPLARARRYGSPSGLASAALSATPTGGSVFWA